MNPPLRRFPSLPPVPGGLARWFSPALLLLASAPVLLAARHRLLSRSYEARASLLELAQVASGDLLCVAGLGLLVAALLGPRVARWAGGGLVVLLLVSIVFQTKVGLPLTPALLRQVGGVLEMQTSIAASSSGRAYLLLGGVVLAFLGVWAAASCVLRRAPRATLVAALVLASGAGALRATLRPGLAAHASNPVTALAEELLGGPRQLDSPLFLGLSPRTPPARPAAPPAGPVRYNVLVIVLESLGGQLLADPAFPEVMPALHRRLPTLHRFPRHYAAFPFSSKSLYTLVCGVPPRADQAIELRYAADRPCGGWSSALRADGYRTWAGHSGSLSYDQMGTFLGAQGFERREDRSSLGRTGAWASNSWGIDDAALPAAFAQWLDTDRPGRFLALALPINSHHPFWTPDPAFARSGSPAHDAFRYQDHVIDQFFRVLADRGLLEETVVVITSDHGRRYADGGASATLEEDDYRVPLWAHIPGAAPRELPPAPTSHVGLGAEILRWARGEAPSPATEAARPPVFLLGLRTPADGMLLDGQRAYYFALGPGVAYEGERWVSELDRPCPPDGCVAARQALLDILSQASPRAGASAP